MEIDDHGNFIQHTGKYMDFFDQMAEKWFEDDSTIWPRRYQPYYETVHEVTYGPIGPPAQEDTEFVKDKLLINGMTKEETNATMSCRGLSENAVFKTWDDKVSPKHYKDIIPGYEYMDVMEHILGFEGTVEHLRGQIFKYMMRFGKKDDRLLESGKIAWYSARLKDVIQRESEGRFPIYVATPQVAEEEHSYTRYLNAPFASAAAVR